MRKPTAYEDIIKINSITCHAELGQFVLGQPFGTFDPAIAEEEFKAIPKIPPAVSKRMDTAGQFGYISRKLLVEILIAKGVVPPDVDWGNIDIDLTAVMAAASVLAHLDEHERDALQVVWDDPTLLDETSRTVG